MEDKDAVSIPLRHGDHFDSTAGYLADDPGNMCSHTVHYQFPTDEAGHPNVEEGPDIIYTTSRMANVRCPTNCVACQGPQVLGVRTLSLNPSGGRVPGVGGGQDTLRGGHENIYDTRKLSENIYGTRRHPEGLLNGAGTLNKNQRNQDSQQGKENMYDVGKRVLYSTSAGVDNVDKQVVTTL